MKMDSATIEKRIAGKLISQALAAGYLISVCDSAFGEGEWVLRQSAKKKEILAAMFSTDSDLLMIGNPADPGPMGKPRKVAAVTLIYGNGADVISDYSAADDAKLEAFTAWLQPVTAYAETFD